MWAAEFSQPAEPVRIVQREDLQPGRSEVRIRVAYCGLCYDDTCLRSGRHPGRARRTLCYPRVPGHEIAGTVDAIGPGVSDEWLGAAVGVGPHGGHCGTCSWCRRGEVALCPHRILTGIDIDGGLARFMVIRSDCAIRLPPNLALRDAAPLLCAGATIFETIRSLQLTPGERVVVQGIGGLGHLLIQVAARMGFEVFAISRGPQKRELAASLGVSGFIDSANAAPGRALRTAGGVAAIFCTAPDNEAIAELIAGLRPRGALVLLGGTSAPLCINPMELIGGRRMVAGILNPTPAQTEAALRFFAQAQIRPRIRLFGLNEAVEAFAALDARAEPRRIVLDTDY